ncbi:MAG: hypothetical protein O7D91_16980 [Planctomycetota bacterium]|nr:hypothetical protein [Planctomycetota bacterium]
MPTKSLHLFAVSVAVAGFNLHLAMLAIAGSRDAVDSTRVRAPSQKTSYSKADWLPRGRVEMILQLLDEQSSPIATAVARQLATNPEVKFLWRVESLGPWLRTGINDTWWYFKTDEDGGFLEVASSRETQHYSVHSSDSNPRRNKELAVESQEAKADAYSTASASLAKKWRAVANGVFPEHLTKNVLCVLEALAKTTGSLTDANQCAERVDYASYEVKGKRETHQVNVSKTYNGFRSEATYHVRAEIGAVILNYEYREWENDTVPPVVFNGFDFQPQIPRFTDIEREIWAEHVVTAQLHFWTPKPEQAPSSNSE